MIDACPGELIICSLTITKNRRRVRLACHLPGAFRGARYESGRVMHRRFIHTAHSRIRQPAMNVEPPRFAKKTRHLACLTVSAAACLALAACHGSDDGEMHTMSAANTASQAPVQHNQLHSAAVKPGYVAVELTNDTGLVGDNEVFVTVTAKTYNPANIEQGDACLMRIAADGTADCERVGEDTKPDSYAVTLASLPLSTNGKRVLFLPKSISGRVYLSLRHPVDLPVMTQSHDGKTLYLISDPDGFKKRDSNYYVFYDKFEYTYTDAGLWANPTAVDFFSIPISLHDPQSTHFSQVGLRTPRASIIDAVEKRFAEEDKSTPPVWKDKLFISYPTEGNVLRIVSPGKAILDDEENSQVNPGHAFPKNYLTSDKRGYNYVQSLWDWYRAGSGNSLTIDMSELAQFRNAPIFHGVTEGDQFVFTNSAGVTVRIRKPESSASFFGGAGGSFDAPNNTPEAIIVRQLTSAFEIGLLPRTGDTLLKFVDSNHQQVYAPYYQTNAHWPAHTGPWYDLYSKALHSFDVDGTQPIYTFAYDDALGQDGTIHVEGDKVQASPLEVTLHDMRGVTIPEFDTAGKLYHNVTLIAGGAPNNAPGNVVHYVDAGGRQHRMQGPDNNGGVTIKVPFLASFCDATGRAHTARIYPDPAMVRPYVSGADGIRIDNSNTGHLTIEFPGLPAGVTCKEAMVHGDGGEGLK